MKIIAILKVVFTLLPVVIAAIKAAEDALQGQGKGEMKLALVRETLEAAFAIANDAGVTFAEVWPSIERAIAVLVRAFNKDGF